ELERPPVSSMMRLQAEIRASMSRLLQSRQSEPPRACAVPAISASTIAEESRTEVDLYIVAVPAGCQMPGRQMQVRSRHPYASAQPGGRMWANALCARSNWGVRGGGDAPAQKNKAADAV